MQIPLLIGLLLPLLSSPWWTHTVFGYAADWEHEQIAADNAAIVLGRKDRELLEYVESANRLLAMLDAVHDPKLAPQIRALHRTVHAASQGMWRANLVEAMSVWRAGGGAPRAVRRTMRVPLQSRRCRVCGVPIAWDPWRDALTTWLQADHPVPIGVGVRLLRERRWDYRLLPLEER